MLAYVFRSLMSSRTNFIKYQPNMLLNYVGIYVFCSLRFSRMNSINNQLNMLPNNVGICISFSEV